MKALLTSSVFVVLTAWNVGAMVLPATEGLAAPLEVYKKLLSFPPTALGEASKATAVVQLRPIFNDLVPLIITQHPDPPFSIDRTGRQRGDTVPTTDRKIEVDVIFAPKLSGEWHDSIVLEVFNPYERVVIGLYGVGASLSRTVFLGFLTAITGDTLRRVAVVRATNNDVRTKWMLVSPIKAPFNLVNRQAPIPISPGSDTLGFYVTFAPTARGVFQGEMKIARLRDDIALDTVTIEMRGTGERMPQSVVETAKPVFVGDRDTVAVVVELPVQPRQGFTYALEPRTSGPVQGQIIEPKGASATTSISLRFECAPTVRGQYEGRFSLLRFGNDSPKPIDSTTVTISGNALERPRPPATLRLGFGLADATVAIGDTVRLPLIIEVTSDAPSETIALRNVACTLLFNPTVLVPIGMTGGSVSGRISIDDAAAVVIANESAIDRQMKNGDTLLTASFVACVGDDDRSTVLLHAVQVERVQGQPIQIRADTMFFQRDASVVLSDVWTHQQGQRRVNTLQGELNISIEPNPVEAVSELRVFNVPADVGTFIIADPTGRVIADFTSLLRSGVTTFTVGSNASASAVLPSGLYYARLLVRGSGGQTIHSVTRLIVVR